MHSRKPVKALDVQFFSVRKIYKKCASQTKIERKYKNFINGLEAMIGLNPPASKFTPTRR